MIDKHKRQIELALLEIDEKTKITELLNMVFRYALKFDTVTLKIAGQKIRIKKEDFAKMKDLDVSFIIGEKGCELGNTSIDQKSTPIEHPNTLRYRL